MPYYYYFLNYFIISFLKKKETCSNYNGIDEDYCEETPGTSCHWCKHSKTCIAPFESCESHHDNTGMIIVIVVSSVGAAALVGFFVYLFVFHGKKKTIKYELLDDVETQSDSEIQKAVAVLRKRDVPAELGLLLNTAEVRFENRLAVNNEETTEFTIQNKNASSVNISLFLELSLDPHHYEFTPRKFELASGETQTIKLTLSMVCTSRLSTNIVIACQEKGYCRVPFKSESEPSSFISAAEVKLGEMTGKGSFGTIYSGSFRGQEVSIEQVNSKMAEAKAEKEIQLVSQLRAPQIVSFFGATKKGNQTLLVLESCKFGVLTAHFNQKKLSNVLKKMIAIDIAKGMQFLHENKIIHRNLKTENIFLVSFSNSAPVRAKVSGFEIRFFYFHILIFFNYY